MGAVGARGGCRPVLTAAPAQAAAGCCRHHQCNHLLLLRMRAAAAPPAAYAAAAKCFGLPGTPPLFHAALTRPGNCVHHSPLRRCQQVGVVFGTVGCLIDQQPPWPRPAAVCMLLCARWRRRRQQQQQQQHACSRGETDEQAPNSVSQGHAAGVKHQSRWCIWHVGSLHGAMVNAHSS